MQWVGPPSVGLEQLSTVQHHSCGSLEWFETVMLLSLLPNSAWSLGGAHDFPSASISVFAYTCVASRFCALTSWGGCHKANKYWSQFDYKKATRSNSTSFYGCFPIEQACLAIAVACLSWCFTAILSQTACSNGGPAPFSHDELPIRPGIGEFFPTSVYQ